MKLRFDLDQAACARAGLTNCASPVLIDVDAATVKLDIRNLLADRLIGNDVCQLWNSDKGTNKSVDANGNPIRLVAEAPTFEALTKALHKDAQIVQARRSCHRAIAIARANTLVESQPLRPTPAPRQISIAPPQQPAASATAPKATPAKAKKPRKKRIPTRAPRRKRTVAS
jgi:hypothetical protein